MVKEKVLFSDKECSSILELHGEFKPSMVYNQTAKVKPTFRISEENDYSGARLVVNGKGCSKEIGNVILFDSARKHKVTKLINGSRYVLVCWLHKEHLKLDGYKTIL